MIYVLILLLIITFVLPLISKKVEENLEPFLFIIGLFACITAGNINKELFLTIFQNKFMYIIVCSVLIGGFLFKALAEVIRESLEKILKYVPLKIFVFFVIVILGLLSSVITAIIASLVLVEIISILPISRKNKIKVDIVACFSIGLGAVLTPVGEPLSTVVVSKLHVDFWFLMREFGIYIIPGIILFGLIGTVFAVKDTVELDLEEAANKQETNKTIVLRAFKIFIFLIALELLGAGFKPIIDTYIIALDNRYLYWVNICSAVLDNATLAAAEISIKMSMLQIKAILMGLLISGGMMIPGNIPNIISAGKLEIKSREWIKLGVPLGFIVMVGYFIIIFVI